jgi:hypothetical protein
MLVSKNEKTARAESDIKKNIIGVCKLLKESMVLNYPLKIE